MAHLPKTVPNEDQSIYYALHHVKMAFHAGTNPFILQGGQNLEFSQRVEDVLKREYRNIVEITGTRTKLTIHFKSQEEPKRKRFKLW
jgi:hypothetical protein